MQRTCSRTDSNSAGRECAAIGAVAPASVAVNAADLQRHWLHCTCQPIVSRISCDLALAGCRMAVTAAQRQSAQLHLRRWQSQRRRSLLRLAQAQSKSAMALFMRLASKPEPSQCPEQRHWLHCTCQPIVSRISCDLALAGCRMAVTAAQRRSAQLHLRRWQ